MDTKQFKMTQDVTTQVIDIARFVKSIIFSQWFDSLHPLHVFLRDADVFQLHFMAESLRPAAPAMVKAWKQARSNFMCHPESSETELPSVTAGQATSLPSQI